MGYVSRRAYALTTITALVAGLSATVPVAAPTQADEATATAPVELTEYTTETTEVLRMPDGSYQLTSNRLPVRVEQDGEWVDINTDLTTGPGGALTPEATTVPIAMSPGGDGPMLTLTEGGATLSLWWESALPTPTVDANSAVYPEVRPGVDLVLSAQPSGFSQALVIHHRQAALDMIANPADVRYTGTGLVFALGEDNTIKATTPDGTVLRSAPPVMWDSSGADQPDAENPEEAKIHRVQATLAIDGSQAHLTLAPPASMIDSPTTTYPLFLDPAIDPNANHYLTVHSKGWDYYDDDTQVMRVGYCGWADCNTLIQGNARSFFSFNVSPISGKAVDAVIHSASVYAKQVYSASSSATPVNLTKAGSFGPNTSYPGPVGAFLQQKSSNAGYGSNPPTNLVFDNADVLNYLQQTANQDNTVVEFALSAPAPDNRNYWKNFANNPELVVKFGFPPTQPTGLDASTSVNCGGKHYVSTVTPTLYAQATERTGLGLLYFFELYKDGNSTPRTKNNTGVPKNSGVTASWDIASDNSTNPDGLPEADYRYRAMARVNDPETVNTPGPWSDWWDFTVDITPPSAPAVSSYAYPPDYWGAPANQPGTLQLAGNADVAGFAWALDGGTVPAVLDSDCAYTDSSNSDGLIKATGGKATLKLPKDLSSGIHTIKVKAFDAAHNRNSTATSFQFYVAPSFSGFTAGSNLQEIEAMPASQPAGQINTTVTTTSHSVASAGAYARITSDRGTPEAPTAVDFAFTVPVDAYYAPGIWLNTQSIYGRLRFSINKADDPAADDRHPMLNQDGTALVEDTMTATPGQRFVPLGEYLPYEGVLLNKGTTYNLRVEIVGTSGTGFSAGLDALTLSPLKQPAFATLADAFNNDGVGTDGATAATFTSASNQSLSSIALSNAGITPGASVHLAGVNFPISQPNPDGFDNVISAGQTITMPPNTGAEAVYLLATSTCAAIAPNPTRKLTIKYTDTASGDIVSGDEAIPGTVPTWLSAAATNTTGIPAHVTTSHHLAGTNPAQPGATLYVLRFPTDSDNRYDRINSITLPRVGTTFTTEPCSTPGTQALHVLSIALQ